MDYSTTVYERQPDGSLLQRHEPIPPERCLYRVDVSTSHGADYATNGLRWDNPEDAAIWGRDLSMRWFAATNIRVVREADDTVAEVIL